MKEKLNILFICTGNICRSAMAEAILKKMIADKNLNDLIEVKSAGISALSGMPATAYSQEAAKKDNIYLSSHRSKPVTESLAEESNYIFVMTQEHINYFKQYYMKYYDKVYALKKFNNLKVKNINIDDPMGGNLHGYIKIYDEIKTEVERIFTVLVKMAKDI